MEQKVGVHDGEKIRVRIAPSPTGDPHVGTGYIALFNYAFAKRHGGEFILRIEDTDRTRSSLESEQAILKALAWLGIKWDEGPDIGGKCGPYRQSERLSIYQKYANELIENSQAYYCVCSSERLEELRKRQQLLKQPTGYDGHCRKADNNYILGKIKEGIPYVIRLKIPPHQRLLMDDMLRGQISINTDEVDDQVLMKSDGFPTYHLANVVDDHLMGITHVIRGEEWISSLPKHILLYQALKVPSPKFCHLPLLRNPDKTKVSKRKNPVSLAYYKEAGFLPEVMLNFFGLMAYSMPDGREIFSLDDFVKNFQIERISLGGPVFDIKKLTWMNGYYIKEKLSLDNVINYLQNQLFNQEYLSKVVPLVKERLLKSEDFLDHADYFFRGEIPCKLEDILLPKLDKNASKLVYEELLDKLDNLSHFASEGINDLLHKFVENHEFLLKDLFMPLRMVLCGKKSSPPIAQVMAVLGKERVRSRMRNAIKIL
jgi:glutamyl-tRNA synthetase